MRFIHTADWHLGRVFHGRSLLEDQEHVLKQLIDLVTDARPDAVLVAGDVFDRPVASADAMLLLDDVLSRIVLGLETPVVMVAGNHDSGSRLAHCAELFRKQNFHVFGAISAKADRVTFEDDHGPLHVLPFPFMTPAEVRQHHGDVELGDHDGAFQALSDAANESFPEGERVVALAHTFIDGGVVCDSERILSVGGVSAVKSSRFDRYCYSALGHLHRPQSVGCSNIRYAGSLLKYSGSEVKHEKSVSIVEIDGAGACSVEEAPLSPLRDLRKVEGEFAELMEPPDPELLRDAYVLVTLHDKGPVLDPIVRLREVYPYILSVDYADQSVGHGRALSLEAQRRMTEAELFARFFEDVTGDPMSTDESAKLQEVLETMERQGREVEA